MKYGLNLNSTLKVLNHSVSSLITVRNLLLTIYTEYVKDQSALVDGIQYLLSELVISAADGHKINKE
jgi:hypothetical protein